MSILQKGIIFCFITILLLGCDKVDKGHERYKTNSYFMLGTIVEITLSEKDLNDYFDNLKSEMKNLGERMVGDINRLNSMKKGDRGKFDKYFLDLISSGGYFSKISGGRFDITIYTLMKLYGFPEGPYRVPENNEVKNVVGEISFENIEIDNDSILKKSDFKIDMGAYGKGWIVDQMVNKMKKYSIKKGIINAGGDLFCLGDKNGKSWRIGIQDPIEKSRTISVIHLKNKAVATSGDYERFFDVGGKRYTHIFDAKKLESIDNYRSVSVIADSVEKADGLSTVYYLMLVDEIKDMCNRENTPVLLYLLDGTILKLCGWENFEKV